MTGTKVPSLPEAWHSETVTRPSSEVHRRGLTVAIPVLVPGGAALVFRLLPRWMSPRRAYNIGFVAYWVGACFLLPVWLLGPQRVKNVLTRGRVPHSKETTLLLLPVVGAIATELLPNRRGVEPRVATVMVTTAAVNAVSEELLWRGLFLEQFPDDVVRGCLWPLAGFTAWHLAPQLILPSSKGRFRFLAGSAVVGGVSAAVSWRHKGLRHVMLPHALTDACGVSAARFRLGKPLSQ